LAARRSTRSSFSLILDPDTRRTAEAEKARRLNPDRAVEDEVVLANEDRRAEAERVDRIGDLTHMAGTNLRTSRVGVRRSSRRRYTRSSGGSRSLRGARAGEEDAAKGMSCYSADEEITPTVTKPRRNGWKRSRPFGASATPISVPRVLQRSLD
jgi:hypothetical protein